MVDIDETKIGAHAILINLQGKLILQKRDENEGIVNPGKIALFGGSLRKGETVLEGLKRELFEELELDISNAEICKVGTINKTKIVDGQDYEANIFIVKPVNENSLVVHEGAGYVCDYPCNLLKNEMLTRLTRMVIEKYLKN